MRDDCGNEFRPIEDFSNFYSRRKGNRPPVSSLRRKTIYKRDGFMCRHCGTEDNLTIDHIIPRSKGGTNKFDNLQTLCFKCNGKKGDK